MRVRRSSDRDKETSERRKLGEIGGGGGGGGLAAAVVAAARRGAKQVETNASLNTKKGLTPLLAHTAFTRLVSRGEPGMLGRGGGEVVMYT